MYFYKYANSVSYLFIYFVFKGHLTTLIPVFWKWFLAAVF